MKFTKSDSGEVMRGPAPNSTRSSYWDVWKGLAIVAVVVIHSCGELSSSPPNSLTGLFGIGLRQIVNFAVPVFLAMAGFFAGRGPSGSPVDFYRKRLVRILAPYLIWTTIYLAQDAITESLNIKEAVKAYLFGTGIGIGYFVIVLTQYTLLTPLITRIKSGRKHFLIMMTITAIGLFFTYYFPALHPESPISKFPAYALPFFVWYPFYHLGIYAAQRQAAGSSSFNGPRKFIALTFIFAIAGFIEGYFWARHGNYSFGTSQLKLTNTLYSVTFFLLILSLSRSRTVFNHDSFLALAGRNSYAVYLVHMILLTPIQRFLGSYPAIIGLQPVYIFLSTSMTLFACIALVLLLRRLLPQRLAGMILG